MSIVKIRTALENAVNAMDGLIPACAITSSASGTVAVFTTSTNHGLTTGLSITITGHIGSTPALNGTYDCVVITANTFSLKHRVTKLAIASTVGGTGGVVTANLIAWENVAFIPVAGVPSQRVQIVPSAPQNPSFGGGLTRELGFLQITLYYPVQFGTFDIMTRAELIKSTFKRGSTFSFGGLTVNISSTGSIMSAAPEDEYFIVGVRMPYWCDVFN
jgi:hypothetical protein